MKRFLLFLLVIIISLLNSHAQVYNPVSWSFSSKHIVGNEYELRFEALIAEGWHMYGLTIPENGPIATSFTFDENDDIAFLTPLSSVEKPEIKYDSTFEMYLKLFSNHVTFNRRVKMLTDKKVQVKGMLEFMACDNSKCLPPKEESFTFGMGKDAVEQTIKTPVTETENTGSENLPGIDSPKLETFTDSHSIAQDITEIAQPNSSSGKDNLIANRTTERSLIGLFLIAFLAGFGALLTPCVYPIIPLTVSFFMRDSARSRAIFNGLAFGVSIIFIYTLAGFIVGMTRLDLVRLISSHWLPNLLFFLIFIALAFSFFGMFEITLPGSLSTSIDKKADKGGLLGPFFMALATVVISFSCTGPIVGVVLGSALHGEIIRPVIGMLGFSISFALPFTLLALFPSFLKNLPKSGRWLNTVKVFFAFILLAFSLIFLANLGLSFITRNSILILAMVIFLLLGLYLLGKIKFSHDSDLQHITVPRLLLAIASFSFAIFLVPGLFGTPLKIIEPFLPVNEKAIILTTDSPLKPSDILQNKGILCNDIPKYSEFLQLPLGLNGYFDYNEALACAKKLNKPVLLDFAGHYCKNCKKMYAEVWSDPRVLSMLSNSFVIASLYTDDRTELPEEDWITSALDGKVKKTLGKKFNDLQITKYGSNALPLYVVVDSEGTILTKEKYYTYSSSVDDFIRFLNDGLISFNRVK